MIKPNEFYAYFTLVGEFDPVDITKDLGIEPTDSWIKGSIHPTSHHEHKFSRWSLCSRLDKYEPIVNHIRDVLKQLEPYKEKIRNIRDRLDGYIQAVAYFHAENPWFHFDEDVVAGCASMKLSIDCDFYTLFSDRRNDVAE